MIQFMRPNEQIVNLLAGEYLMLAFDKAPDAPTTADPFDSSRGFTGRVALSTRYCAVTPPDVPTPNPINPSLLVKRRPDEALYQLGLSIDPPETERGPIVNILNFENGRGFISLSAYWQSVIHWAFLLVVVVLQNRLAQRRT